MHRSNKANPAKNSKKITNIFQPNIKVYQSPNPANQNIIYSNSNNYNFKNPNIRTNKMQYNPKEKIIEGELNFSNNKNKIMSPYNRISNNAKQKKVRSKPTKSPIPIPRDYKFSKYQRLFINHKPNNNNILKPKSAMQRKNNFMVNNNNLNENNNIKKPNNVNIGSSSNFISNRTYNAFNIFRKNLERKQSPFQKAPINNYNLIQKGQIKSRYVSKSPILSKGSKFNKYKINIFGNINNNNNINNNTNTNNISSTSNNTNNNTNNNKNIKKKAQIKNNNNKKQMTNHKQNNIINNNNIRTKGPTLIQVEFNQDSNGEKFNINQKNIDDNNIIKNINSKDEIQNIKPIYNPQNIKAESNNVQLNNKPEINNIYEKEKENNNKKVTQKETKKRKPRSQSTGLINPLEKDSPKEKEEKEKEILLKKEKEEKKENTYITKKIKDILPYSHVGFDGEEPKENNQDNYFIYKNFMNKKDYIYMSVCDGHGIEGHFVSDFMKEILPYDMSENLKNFDLMTKDLKEKEKINQIIKETFIIANDKLVENEEINSLFSGSTCVSVIYTPYKLIVPNIGDSRAVLGRLINKETNEYKAIELSRDHKPTEKDEAQRIIENDGRIQPFIEEGEFVGPQRVWIKEEEVPGLAMTRSFGDRVAATVGVISEPEIKEFLFDEGDKFMIVASDGILEFISSQECVDIIKDFYEKNDMKGCAEHLYEESSRRWLKEEEVIDDTTLILVFFE